MPYGNNQNGQQGSFSVSSSLISMFDENSNQLRVAGYDSGLQLAIWIPERNDGHVTYPKEKRFSVILSQEAAAVLDHVVNRELIAAIEQNQTFRKGIVTNRSATNIVDLIRDEQGDVYLQIHKELDMNKVPKYTFVYKFDKSNIIQNYDPSTGEFEVKQADVQLAMFCNTISAYNGIAMAAGHGSRVAMNYSIGRMYQYLQAIAQKLGAAVNTSSYSGGTSYQPQNRGDGYNNAQQGYTGPVNESNDLNALLS